ncbi:AAA family ATPase [Spirosoma sp. KUDC1026]|uniref:AAA family ATPase n=1 Tax=Spirosoma sp. KUDC1026 TaxID=2745947 RepID=UPI00159BE619|nr:AAA family ATPase [Spirosoma sp. KUDC1026]QKZ13360.1 AAA family ATPase [Spirosoma sp. KUDC1026]
MAKLTVKNVGPIRDAELEVKKHTVFIGPQGTGKSTLAKLIAIGEDSKLNDPTGFDTNSLIIKYSLDAFIEPNDTSWKFHNDYYCLEYDEALTFTFTPKGKILANKYLALFIDRSADAKQILPLEEFRNQITRDVNGRPLYNGNAQAQSQNFYSQILPIITESISTLVPAERHLFPLLSSSIWSFLDADINLPQSIKAFGREFERARNRQQSLALPFLKVQYSFENGRDLVYFADNKSVELAQSASGYQSTIPLALVVDYQRQQAQRRFIIEEPELNLYPTAQKDLIYSLMGGLQPNADYKDAEWVITTHSPYVLSSFNTLMLAYKVAQRSEELRAEVEKIIPAQCWINPDEFAAYYVDNGTVRSIISEKTGLIADNELDDVSDTLANEQDKLFDLSRKITRV